jgi:hypothetical protein
MPEPPLRSRPANVGAISWQPWVAATVEATPEDAKAVYAYLRTIKPIKNRVPEPLPPPAAAASR